MTGRPLTVLHIAPTPFFSDRGCHMRVRGIISALNRRGVRNILCTYHHGRDVPGIDTVRTPRLPGYTKEEAGPSVFKYLADILLFIRVLGVMWRERPDIVHGHLHEGALIGWAARTCLWWRKTPLVFDMQGSLVGELAAHGYFDKLKPLRRVFRGIEHLICRLPDHFLCSAEASAEILRSGYRVAPERIEIVHDGVDVSPADSATTKHRMPDLGLPTGKPVIVYTGALLEAKGFEALQNVILEAKARRLDCHFLLVGYPEGPARRFLATHGLESYGTLTGRVPFDHLQSYLALAAVAVEPKASESGEASGKLLNYMHAGLPVVCFDTRNNRQILGDGGYYVAPGSIGGFADQIGATLLAVDEAKARGAAGRRRVVERFSWDSAAERIVAVYGERLGLAGSPRPLGDRVRGESE